MTIVSSPFLVPSLSGSWKPWFSTRGPEPQSASSKTHKTARQVLVIDDEASIADSLAEILTSQGFEARAFYRGQSAIDFARKNCPDIVLADVVMPKLNGVETVLAIRQLCPATRILLFSGQAEPQIFCSKLASVGTNSSCFPSRSILTHC